MARASAAIAALFLVIYLPDAGHGFIQDDFRWLVESQVDAPTDVLRLFTTNVGFYRPVVSLTFAADEALWGTSAIGYALTNLALCLGAAWSLFALARTLELPAPAAVAAAGGWLLNFHAVNMAVLWLSGRTALLVSLFALLATRAIFRSRAALAGLFSLLAMLSKEEGIVLPALFTTFLLLSDRNTSRLGHTIPSWIALAIYLALRINSGAFWPGDAPSFYRFTFAPADVSRNVVEYADRAGTLSAIAILVFAVTAGVRWRHLLGGRQHRALTFAALWIAATYSLTMFLPVRSSLYALLPSAGCAIVLGVVAAAAAAQDRRRFRVAAIGLLLVATALVPVYRTRNARWVRPAELAEHVLSRIARDTWEDRPAGHVVLIDDPTERFNLTAAFGGLFPEALRLYGGGGWTGEIVQAQEEATRPGDVTYSLRGGELSLQHP